MQSERVIPLNALRLAVTVTSPCVNKELREVIKMANYKMIGKNFAKELNNRLTVIHLSEMEKYNKPLIVSS